MTELFRKQLLVAAVVAVTVVPALVNAQTSSSNGKSIVRPDFPCGVPYGPNGELPSDTRVKRQIILPDDENYQYYLGLLKESPLPDIRGNQETTLPSDEEPVFCGVTVISDRFLITAAHCIFDENYPFDTITLGDRDLSVDDEANSKAADYVVESIYIHPDYNENTTVRYSDLALLKTTQRIQFNDVVYPMCVSATPPAPGDILTVSGFGFFNATVQPTELLETNVTVMDTAECENVYVEEGVDVALRLKYPNFLQGQDILCARDDISDACQGDSGGPIYRKKDGKLFLEGVVSGGATCHSNFNSVLPGLYITLAKHIDFIDERMYGSEFN